MAKRYGLIPPDGSGIYGPGETLTYACQRLLTGAHAGARVSAQHDLEESVCQRNRAAQRCVQEICRRADSGTGGSWWMERWRIPWRFRSPILKAMPVRSQITEVACEEGWSYIAEWIGTPLSGVLREAGVLPQTHYIVYYSIENGLVGEHRHGGCVGSAHVAHHRHERRRSAGAIRRAAASALAAPTRLQEREVRHAHHGDRQHQEVRQGAGLASIPSTATPGTPESDAAPAAVNEHAATASVAKIDANVCVAENPMRMKQVTFVDLVFVIPVVLAVAAWQARSQAEKSPYPSMAPLDQYLIPDRNSEIALARTGAPASISDGAEVMVLGREGYTTAVKGTNGFLCIVERSWGAATDEPEFWNPKVRAPICFNPAAARSFVPIFLMKTKLVLAGKIEGGDLAATASALDKKELPALEPGAMCYMMSKQQYLNDAA